MKTLFRGLVPTALAILVASCGGTPPKKEEGIRLRERVERTERLRLTSLREQDTLVIESPAGGIQVIGGASGEPGVLVVLETRGRTREEAADALARYRVAAERGREGLRVVTRGTPLRIEGPKGETYDLTATMKVHARVPSGIRLVISTGDGDVRVEGAVAGCEVRTLGGDVRVTGAVGTVRLHSASGDVSLDEFTGKEARLTADFGDLSAIGEFTDFEARTGSGDVSVFVRKNSVVRGIWEIESAMGDLSLSLPDGFPCVLDAVTSLGTVRSDLPITSTPGEAFAKNTIRLRAANGDIRVKVVE